MSVPFLLIDGYNLLHAAGLSQARYAPGDLRRQRHRLLVRLARELTTEERVRCTVVFDAIEAPSGLDRSMRHAELLVRFADPGHDADSLIEELIESHSSPTQLLVVSSDHRIQKAANRRRAETVDSEVLLQRLAARARAAAQAKPEPPKSVKNSAKPGEELAYWLSEFGEIDVAQIARSDDPESSVTEIDPWQQNLNELQKQLDQDADFDEWLNRPPKGKGW